MGIDEEKVIPDKSLSVYEGAVAAWKGEKGSWWLEQLIAAADAVNFPIHRRYEDLTRQERKMLWEGTKYFQGINEFFRQLEESTYKIQSRVMLARYRGRTVCPTCDGGRLRKEATYVKIGGKAITDLIDLPIDELLAFFESLKLNEQDLNIGKRLLLEIENRLRFMTSVGLSYLTLNRTSAHCQAAKLSGLI